MKVTAEMMKKITEKTLKKEANSMCLIIYGQAKEPQGIKKFRNEK